jgi:uncharacterized membrane protein YkvI
MPHTALEYARGGSSDEKLPVVLAAVVPFLTVPVYVVGTILLQDALVNGDGRSWQRAAIWMALPTGSVTAAALAVGVLGLLRPVRPRRAAILATVAGALALACIVWGTLTA